MPMSLSPSVAAFPGVAASPGVLALTCAPVCTSMGVARPPRDSELAVLRKLYEGELAAGNEDAAWFAVASALLNLDETITKN